MSDASLTADVSADPARAFLRYEEAVPDDDVSVLVLTLVASEDVLRPHAAFVSSGDRVEAALDILGAEAGGTA